ncbi:FkbM family methyltransferase [Litchfieldella rifensis]|uniref:FkbM family methyltransferase n=1 Tax=Litchfieldella rifensis TaxID=762643 RepID=A0ABV7LUF7_9GAMM
MIQPTDDVNGTILHIGAGECQELSYYLETSAETVVLVEPNPEAATKLRQQSAAHFSRINIHEMAVSKSDGKAPFKVLNYPAFSSLHESIQLRTLFPGLLCAKQVEVETKSATNFFNEIELNPRKKNWLIVDAPGDELEILQACKKNNHLHKFQFVTLHCSVLNSYRESIESIDIKCWLVQQGYKVNQTDDSDPDSIILLFSLDVLRVENRALKEENIKLKSDLSASLRQKSLQEADLEELKKRYLEVREAEKRQHELLIRIKQSLLVAKEYLHLLEDRFTKKQ